MRAEEDSDAVDESVDVDFTCSGGGYNDVEATRTFTVVDDEAVGITFTATPVSVAEGSTGTFSLRLSTQPSSSVTITASSNDTTALTVSPSSRTFSTSNWNTAQNFTVTAPQDQDSTSESVTMTFSASGGDYADVEATRTVTVTDDETEGLVFDAAPSSIAEGGTATFEVRLSSQPSATVTVSASSDNTNAITISPSSRTYLDTNWLTAQDFTISAPQDANAVGEAVNITFDASGGDYGSVEATRLVTVTDDETQGIFLPGDNPNTIAEGQVRNLSVYLTSQPTGNVTVTATGDDDGALKVGTSASNSLTFTPANWNTAQSMQITGLQDTDESDEDVTVTFTASGADYADVEATTDISVTDDDYSFDIALFQTSITEGSSDTYNLRLSRQPPGNVTVTTASGNTAAVTVTTGATRTFNQTNWNSAKTVTLTAQQDEDTENDTAVITTSATGFTSHTRTVTVTDDDIPGYVYTVSNATVAEGGTRTFQVRLSTQPSANVTVGVTSEDTSIITVSPSSLTFTASNWNTNQTVTITGVEDSDASNETVDVEFAGSGGGYNDVDGAYEFTVIDDESPGLMISGLQTEIAEDSTDAISVRLESQPTSTVTITVTSSNTGIGTVSPATRSFTTSNWNTDQTFTYT